MIYKADMLRTLSDAVEFEMVHEGRTVFMGRVDEFEAQVGKNGATVKLGGRGMQALMLDNEAESADYYYVDMNYIVSRHAVGAGVKIVDSSGATGSAERFSVENGDSHWKVFSSFAEFCCGIKPRFAADGTLVLNGTGGGDVYIVNDKTAVISQRYGEDRYGVISKAIVKRRYTNMESETENVPFVKKGGNCVRIINVPKSTHYDAMRHEAEYQIKKSMESYRLGSITVAECFPAFPGDTLVMESSPLGLTGEFMVSATRCRGGTDGVSTEIEITKI